MSFAFPNSAETYAKVGIETGVAAADPHRLILMLFVYVLFVVFLHVPLTTLRPPGF